MQHHRISKLLSDSTVSKFIKRKWIEGNDLSGGQYPVHSNIRFKTSMLRSDFCDDSYTYVVVKMKSDVAGNDNGNRRNKKLAFKKMLHLGHTYEKFIDNAKDLDIVMLMYNL